MIDKKTIRKTIRLTDTQENFINTFPGDSFNEKLDQMLSSFMTDSQEIDSLYEKKMRLVKDIQSLETIKENVTEAFKSFNSMAQQFDSEYEENALKRIKDMIAEQGFIPTERNVRLLHRLDQLTGRNNNLQELVDAHKEQLYKKNGKMEEQSIVEDLCNEFRNQEIMRDHVIQQ